jgi:alpha-tubulin suppressor-like RCC1 family protein
MQVGIDTDWAAVSAGSNHTMALKSDGTLWAWGYHEYGKLGDGTLLNRTTPVQISTDNDWVSVDAGYNHTLAVKSDGSVWSWGWNAYGQAGDGTVVDKYAPVMVSPDAWMQPTAGWGHSVGLKSDGKLYAWGYNADGELGNGVIVNILAPAQVLAGGEIVINDGANFTNSTSVMLSLTPGNPSELVSMKFSNDNVNWSNARTVRKHQELGYPVAWDQHGLC